MAKTRLAALIAESRGKDESLLYDAFRLQSTEPIEAVIHELLLNTPPSFGACAMLSAGLSDLVRRKTTIPVMAVAGDLEIDGVTTFQCVTNIPMPRDDEPIHEPWDGHCWVEIDDWVVDISIVRTARLINQPSNLANFIKAKIGTHRGAILAGYQTLSDDGMVYTPKYVLDERQVGGLISGLMRARFAVS